MPNEQENPHVSSANPVVVEQMQEAAAGHAWMCVGWARKMTIEAVHLNKQAVENWKLNAPILKSLGLPLPPLPILLPTVTCDRNLAAQRYTESMLTGEPIVIDYFKYHKQDLPDMSFGQDDIDVPEPDDPVGQIIKIRFQWKTAPGETYLVGDRHQHPEIGLVEKIKFETPFSTTDYRWRAVTKQAKDAWTTQAKAAGLI